MPSNEGGDRAAHEWKIRALGAEAEVERLALELRKTESALGAAIRLMTAEQTASWFAEVGAHTTKTAALPGGQDDSESHRAGIAAVLRWLHAQPRYDLSAEEGGCVIVLDLRDVESAFAAALPGNLASSLEENDG